MGPSQLKSWLVDATRPGAARLALTAAAAISTLAGSALAQPTLTSLGNAAPNSVTNSIGGSIYIGGSAGGSAIRFTLSGSGLSSQQISGTSGGGLITPDGSHLTALVVNNSPRILGNTATGVSPIFSTSPTLVASTANPAATELCAAVYNVGSSTLTRMGGLPIVPSLLVFGSGSSGGSSSSFETPNVISSTGRFVGGQGYISTYNSAAGTSITDNTFGQVRPWIWDAQANGGAGGITVLPTPKRTTSNTWKYRIGAVYGISTDGTVIVGGQEYNSSVTPSADPDGARIVVWRWNTGTSQYDMSFLPTGVDASGFPNLPGTLAGTVWMNAAGTIIVGPCSLDNTGQHPYLAKWVWNAGTSSWNAPISLATGINPTVSISTIDSTTVTTATPHGLQVNDWVYISGNSTTANNGWHQVLLSESPTTFSFSGMAAGTGGTGNKGASWLPPSVTSCAIAPAMMVTGISEDGNTVVGIAKYSTCGNFYNGGFIWTSSSGYAADWYDYLHGLGVPGVTTGGSYGPSGISGDMTLGLPYLGNPTAVSPDGSTFVGLVTGSQLLAGAAPWVLANGGPSCVAPAITVNPSNFTYSHCTPGVTGIVPFNVTASGTAPFSYQWYKDGTALTDDGTHITGSQSFQLRVIVPQLADNGNYHCVVTGCNGATAQSTDATLVNETTAGNAGDTCATAIAVNGEGTTSFNICDCYINEGYSACGGTEIADIFFKYTPSFTGNARFQTCSGGFDSTVELLDTCGGSVLSCNNDIGARGLAGISCGSTRSLISSYPVVQGQPIIVRVGAVAPAASSTGKLTISVAPSAPVNDLCSNATPVGLGTFPFNLAEATDDFNFGAAFCSGSTNDANSQFSNRDVWFKLVSPWGGTYTISTCGSAMSNPVLHVMPDCTGNNIIACSDDVGSGVTGCGSQQARILNLQVSGSVLIRVAASGLSAPSNGAGQIVITGTPNIGCSSADFNCDGDIGTDLDIEAFFACLAGNCPPFPCMNNADFNGDGDIGTDADIEAFFRVLAGGAC
jgi:hypothetical protein